ncbi:unnamed protein product [Eruca vesicaria subsp. sativa]|uniref:F-box domain-containing protein n=1 Tax=Eruca vesicaria subsp. sativa TaxID=29727 RepID=A0ABC8LJB8_ERUVS|nr:unnamed protein product [Eruca vesicaria subsp. sativa]
MEASLERISQLPDALLVKILSSLPTTKVVATTLLSKQWRSIWNMVPSLKFICNGGNDLEGFIRRTMLSLEALYLQSLHMDVSLGQARNLCNTLRQTIRAILFRYIRCALETLKLRGKFGSIALQVPSPVCLKSLRTLHLEDLFYQDDESVVKFLAGCVSLEDLFVTRWGCDGVDTFTIAVPSLQELTIEDDVTIRPDLVMINAPELVEAKIWTRGVFGESLTSVKRLSLRMSRMEIPAGSIFNQLEYLQLLTSDPESWKLLRFMLDNSPNLQVLDIFSVSIASSTFHKKYCSSLV